MFYFKRNWDESRGDKHDDWGTSVWYFETGPDWCVMRQIEVYESGTVLQYDQQHIEDTYGKLSEQALDPDDFLQFAIPQIEFEEVWISKKPFNQ